MITKYKRFSAKESEPKRLKKWGYVGTALKGVYRSQYPLFREITLLSLNQLSDEPHNAFVKCFASQKAEKKKAFNLLRQTPLKSATTQLEYFLEGLWQHWFVLKGDDMTIKLTSEQVTEMGKMWGDSFFARLTLDDVFTRFKREEILAQFKPVERLAGLKPVDRLAGLKPQEIEDYLKKLKEKG